MSYKKRTIKERLLRAIKINLETGCWEWQKRTDYGYGRIRINHKNILAHRASFAEFVGDPTGWLVCHQCDNRRCINPLHLWLGTAQDNTNDMLRKRAA